MTDIESLDTRIKWCLDNNEHAMAIELMDLRHKVHKTIQERKLTHSQLQPKGDKQTPKDYLFITVNPSSVVPLLDFRRTLDKMTSKVWFNQYVYVLEQRGTCEEELGKGFHMHCIVKKPDNKVPSHMIRELQACFRKVCDVSNYHLFNTKWIDQAECNRKQQYLLGRKEWTEADRKDLKQDMDIIWREKEFIAPSYSKGIVFSS